MTVQQIIYCPDFKTALKPLYRKHPFLKDSIKELEKQLRANPTMGDSYGDNIYKIRLPDVSSGKGKSGGFRLFYYHLFVNVDNKTANLIFLTIFGKSYQATIKKKVISKLKDAVLRKMGISKK